MRTEQEIRARLEELMADIRLTYEPASVTINAPLALKQCAITSMIDILTWVLEPRNLDYVNAEWVKKYCDMTITEETERFERDTRPRNDACANGFHTRHCKKTDQKYTPWYTRRSEMMTNQDFGDAYGCEFENYGTDGGKRIAEVRIVCITDSNREAWFP